MPFTCKNPPLSSVYIQTPDVNPILNTSADIKIKKGKKKTSTEVEWPKPKGIWFFSLIFDDKLKSWSTATLKVEFNFDIYFFNFFNKTDVNL